MKVTLKQIAERTGVSINTVSMVLRGMSGISAPTRDRVRRAAGEMGYRRQLKPAATKQSLCLVSAERHRRESYSYTEFNRNFLSYAASHEFSVVTAEAEQFRDDPEGAQRRIEEAGVGGILTLDPKQVDMGDGLFEILLVRAPENLGEIHECIQALQSQKYNCAMLTFRSAQKVRIFADPEMPWTLDGEKEDGHETVEVENLHHAIRLMQKKDEDA